MLRKGHSLYLPGSGNRAGNQVFHGIDAFDDISTLNEYEVALKEGLSPDQALAAVARNQS